VTTPDLQQDTFVGIRAVFAEKPYAVNERGSYFVALEDAWQAGLALASHNARVRDALRHAVDALVKEESDHLDAFTEAQSERLLQIATFYSWFYTDEEEVETFSQRLDQLNEDANAELDSEFARIRSLLLEASGRTPVSFTISRLRIESPMELAVAVVQTGGPTALAVYALHLLVPVMRDPERVGAWLPRLPVGLRKGMTEAERAGKDLADARAERKKQRAIDDAADRLITAAKKIKALPAAEATAIGAGDAPDDIVAAMSE
jgi:hypothetical protein